ncbi:hypothetical protein CDD82_6388 [Ophiocordyceps australis]|uniref:Transcription factor domain-containing protein n=1 Tax=Ophiocordyceps australis TaxID=1399860 RepID=A0A2C5Y0M6_9HYPO|nr:hypothetical protein CDD82_6388 [Ophiocordyceps australis]
MKQSDQATRPTSQEQLDVLLRSIVQFLDRGETDKAATAFGLVLKFIDHKSHPFNLRNYGIWTLGCEVLMRQSMLPTPQDWQSSNNGLETGNRDNSDIQQAPSSRVPNIWGLSPNIRTIKTYFEVLGLQCTQHKSHQRTTRDFGYQLANLVSDVYRIHTEHSLSLARIDMDQQEADSIMLDGDGEDDAERWNNDLSKLAHEQRQELNRKTLLSMNDVFRILSGAEHGIPITMRQDFDRLKNVLSLYMKDLAMALAQ